MALPAAMISVYKPLAQLYLLPMQQKRIAQAPSNARHPAIAPRLPLGGLKAIHFSRHKPLGYAHSLPSLSSPADARS